MYPIVVIDTFWETAEEIKQSSLWNNRSDFAYMGSVSDESKAIDFIKCNNSALVFIATNHRAIDDIQLIKDIRRQLPDIHFVLVSEEYTYQRVRDGFLAGAFDYILRPIDEQLLEDTVSRIYNDFGNQYIRDNLMPKVNIIIENIFQGRNNIPYMCIDILDHIYNDWHKDLINCHIIIEKTKEKIYEEIIYRKPWIKKFIYSKNFVHCIGSGVKPEPTVKSEWISHFLDVAAVVKKYRIIDNTLIYNIGKYVVVHVDEHLTLEKVANSVFLNKSYISHIFKKISGVSFVNFMTDVKIDRAKILLMNSELKIYEIAAIIGYNNPEYFSRVFKNITGITPNEYRDSLLA